VNVDARPLRIEVNASVAVSGLWVSPSRPAAGFVLAHGAGAGMQHAFMVSMAGELQQRNIATLRYQFPYFERGSRRPDPPALCHATVRAAVRHAAELAPDLPLFAGGKSFGGRMSSQAQALEPLPQVRGLAFLGFPLHPAGAPSDTRAEHLSAVQLPMLFLQGTRDELADPALLQAVIARLGPRATLLLSEGADHAFHVRASSGTTDAQVRAALADRLADWMVGLIRSGSQ
jgi:predicted alpha/beta-hydrolase family hydrolase